MKVFQSRPTPAARNYPLPVLLLCSLFPVLLFGQSIRIITNHVGYEYDQPKKAIIMADSLFGIPSFQLMDTATGKFVYSGRPVYCGHVDHWKNWVFWTVDFSDFKTTGAWMIMVMPAGTAPASAAIISYPFLIGKNLLERSTISDLVYYFKGQRSSGLLDKADRQLHLAGKTKGTRDVHGGWYDATGDYGIHLSHLSFSSYFNPQQVPLTAWSLFKTYESLGKRPGTDYRQYRRRLLDEAMYGADFLVRMRVDNGSFYRSISAPGPGKLAKDRVIGSEDGSYRIKQTKDQSFRAVADTGSGWRSYQSSWRSGGGMSIAVLAIASTYDTTGEFSREDYLRAAEGAFAFLDQQSLLMTNDKRENIVDDYCALSAATELYKATHNAWYDHAARIRAWQLVRRLSAWGKYNGYWRADDDDRPFFHPSDAGLPIVSLLNYYPYAPADLQAMIKDAVRKSVRYELWLTHEVNNPFGYSRQLVQDTLGQRHSAFFFPHGSEASPWWQGENARLGSMAAAAKMAAGLFADERPLHDSLQAFALDQLNWILGLNPFDACMLQGTGHNNPAYGFFGTFEYTNAPGGIVNGITSGLTDENDIDFNLSYSMTKKDYDWRWAEQWLPHAAWYLFAVSVD